MMEKKSIKIENGMRVSYIECGPSDGQILLFIHGFSGSKTEWAADMEALSDTYHSFAIDFPGHGDTEFQIEGMHKGVIAEEIHQFIEALSLENVILIGMSMGGRKVIEYVYNYGGDHLNGTILMDTTPYKEKTEDWDLGPTGSAGQSSGLAFMKRDYEGWANAFLRACGFQLDPPEVGQKVLDDFYQKVKPAFAVAVTEIDQLDFRKAIERWPVPCAYFYADPGSILKPELSEYYAKTMPSPYKGYPFHTRSHAFTLEFTDEVIASIRNFAETMVKR